MTSQNNVIFGDFSAFFPDRAESLKIALEADFLRGLNARSTDRQAQKEIPPQWEVVVKNLRTINNNTELEFDVEAVQTRLAPTADVIAAAPEEALEDFSGFYEFAAVTTNTPLASVDELYTATTGQALPNDAFISRAAISTTVQTNVFTVSTPQKTRDGIHPASIAVPAVLGGLLVCILIGACVAVVIKRRRAQEHEQEQEQEQEAEEVPEDTEPYGALEKAENPVQEQVVVLVDPFEAVKVNMVENAIGGPALYSPRKEEW